MQGLDASAFAAVALHQHVLDRAAEAGVAGVPARPRDPKCRVIAYSTRTESSDTASHPAVLAQRKTSAERESSPTGRRRVRFCRALCCPRAFTEPVW